MRLAIVIVVIVIVVIVVVLAALRTARSRSERSDWLGELSEIRRASLGDDQEVTGAIEAVTIVEDPTTVKDPTTVDDPSTVDDPDGVSATRDPADDPSGAGASEAVEPGDIPVPGRPGTDGLDGPPGETTEPVVADPAVTDPVTDDAEATTAHAVRSVTHSPTRTVSDAGTLFNEYEGDAGSLLRVEVTDPNGLRVMATGSGAAGDPTFAVDLHRGVLWFRSAPGGGVSVRVPAGWARADGVVAIVGDDRGWSYVMCIDGTVSLRSRAGGGPVELSGGRIGRLRVGESVIDVVEVGSGAIESEGVVRRQRRLDGAAEARE